jgi:hypothetical protein
MKKLLFAALCLIPFSASAAGLNSTYLTTSATAIYGGGSVVGFLYNAPGAGIIQFRANADPSTPVTAGSPVKHTFATAAISGASEYIELPEPYLEFRGGLYITLTGVRDVTVVYK